MADGYGDLPGSQVVVTAAPGSDDLRAIADRAPASVILVAAGREVCQAVLDATFFPAPRVVGITGGGQEVADAAAAVAFDRYEEHDCLVSGRGGYVPARARLGRRGVREIV